MRARAVAAALAAIEAVHVRILYRFLIHAGQVTRTARR